MSDEWKGELKKIDDYRWEIPKESVPGMRVSGLIFASEKLIPAIRKDKTPQQVANVATLPGIVFRSLAMPDIHWGYGLPIGGVAGIRISDGVISPGGVGSDINCGVRLIKTNLVYEDIKDLIKPLIFTLFKNIPCGVGEKGKLKLSRSEEEDVLINGAKWAVKKGYGWKQDLENIEENGSMQGADPNTISQKAFERGASQLGTLGAGNHFLEIDEVIDVFDENIANVLGLYKGQITITIHTGSRGLGYQVCEDYIKVMLRAIEKYKINLPDRQLACAPFDSPEGRQYFSAMSAAANYAWANRQVILHWTRESFEEVLKKSAENLGMTIVYDVAHNIAKIEDHIVEGEKMTLCVHRKGATRAFPPGSSEIPKKYINIGQPVLVPGDMGTASYVLVGTEKAMEETFGSACHGAGRLMSRTAALKAAQGRFIDKELEDKGIFIKARDRGTLAEESPEAYKDVIEVVEVVANAGIAKKVVKLKPLGVIKG